MSDPYSQVRQPPQHAGEPNRRGTVVGLVVLAVIVAIIGVASYLVNRSDPDKAAIGDCVTRGSGSDVRVVECTDSDSAYKVVGRVPGKTQIQFSVSSGRICDPFPAAKTAFWRGERGGTGYVLCLAPVK